MAIRSVQFNTDNKSNPQGMKWEVPEVTYRASFRVYCDTPGELGLVHDAMDRLAQACEHGITDEAVAAFRTMCEMTRKLRKEET